MSNKKRILCIPSDTHGVGKYRILDPYKHLSEKYGDQFHVDISFDVPNMDSAFNNYDAVVLHTFIHKTSHEQNLERMEWLKKQGIKVIVDIDDHWIVDKSHPMYQQIKNNGMVQKRVKMLEIADYISTTTPIFKDTIHKKLGLGDITHVFPNAIDPTEEQFQSKPHKSDRVRFGWLGGSSHLKDLLMLGDGINHTLSSYKDKVQFVLCGFDLRGKVTEINRQTGQPQQRDILPHETVWFAYENIFTNKYKSVSEEYKNYLLKFQQQSWENDLNTPYVRRWTEKINKYGFNYNYFDISLAPLVNNEFNSNKSQLKIIEAGFHKKPIIASNVKPYTLDLINAVDQGIINNKGNSLLVDSHKNHKDWGKHMKRLIENPSLIEDLGNRLYETVKDTYSLDNVTMKRVEFFNTIINK